MEGRRTYQLMPLSLVSHLLPLKAPSLQHGLHIINRHEPAATKHENVQKMLSCYYYSFFSTSSEEES